MDPPQLGRRPPAKGEMLREGQELNAMHWKPSLSTYPGLQADPLLPDAEGRALGNVILLARILGMVQREETCAGWSATALSHLREAVWHRYERAPTALRDAIDRQLRRARFQVLKKRRLYS